MTQLQVDIRICPLGFLLLSSTRHLPHFSWFAVFYPYCVFLVHFALLPVSCCTNLITNLSSLLMHSHPISLLKLPVVFFVHFSVAFICRPSTSVICIYSLNPCNCPLSVFASTSPCPLFFPLQPSHFSLLPCSISLPFLFPPSTSCVSLLLTRYVAVTP